MISKQPRQVARTYAKFLGGGTDIIGIQSPCLNQGQGALDCRPRALPRRAERRGLRSATQTGAIAGPFRGRCTRIEGNVARKRSPRRANRTAIDPCCLDRDEHDAVEGGIASPQRCISCVEVEHAADITLNPRKKRPAGYDQVRKRPIRAELTNVTLCHPSRMRHDRRAA